MNNHKPYRFRVRVEDLAESSNAHPPLDFIVENHDDILAIVHRVGTMPLFAAEDAKALALGMKLFGSDALKYRNEPLFSNIQPALRALIGN